jgi:hypothetical protein
MGMQDFTRHQQGIIKRYYENIDGISLQKLGELVTDLYLAEGKKREKLWKTAVATMQKLGVPQTRIDALVAKNSPEALAGLVKEIQSQQS